MEAPVQLLLMERGELLQRASERTEIMWDPGNVKAFSQKLSNGEAEMWWRVNKGLIQKLIHPQLPLLLAHPMC